MIANTLRKLNWLAGDLQERLLAEGWQQTSRWLFQTVASLPCRRIEYQVFARSLLEPLPTLSPRLPVTLRLATESDLACFEGLVSSSELRRFRRRLVYGRHCFLALDGERLAAYCWATAQVEFDVDNLKIPLKPGDVYLDDAYTLLAYRRLGIQSAVHLHRLQCLQNWGYRRAILIVRDTNVASQRLVSQLGYQKVARLSFRRVLWQRSYRYHRGAL